MQSVVVLDLDATLVNTFGNAENWNEVDGECRTEQCKRIFVVNSESGFVWGAKRPNLDTFLNSCFHNFDVVGVWSAGSYQYVNEIANEIFTENTPDFVWTKEDCVTCYVEEDETYVRSKPLVKLWDAFPDFDKRRTLLIDDAPDVCAQNPLNHVLIPSWTGKWDTLSKPDEVLNILSTWFRTDAKFSPDLTTAKIPDLSSGFHNF